MKFSINQTELQTAIGVVQKGISARSTMPILAGIYVETEGDELVFQSTNLELSVKYRVAALIEEEGKAVLPGKLFGDIVKSLPDAAVHVKTDGMTAVIACESSSFSLKGLDPIDWPGFPEVQEEQTLSIPFDTFASMAKKVCRITSRDESRPILTGVLVTADAQTIKMVATDSYRLGVAEADLENASEPFSAVIAGSFISDLASLPKTGADISLALAANQIVVAYQGTTFVNRRIEGTYPDYRRLLPNGYQTRCLFQKDQFTASVKRAALLDRNATQVRLNIEPTSQTVQISSVASDVGSAQEIIPATIDGPEVEIGFNSNYVTDGISGFESDEIYLEIQSSLKPGVFKGVEERFLYLVMPVRL